MRELPLDVEPLDQLDELSHAHGPLAALVLTNRHKRRRDGRKARLEISQQLEADVGIADPAEGPAHALEPRDEVVCVLAALPCMRKWQ